MTTLVIGDAASGKSAYAERILCKQSGDLPRFYIATMQPFGEEAERRIARHRDMRREKNFNTIECYVNLSGADVTQNSALLLEDIGNLCANELFSPSGSGENAAEAILHGIERLQARCQTLVIVSNEVFCGGTDYAGETMRYLSILSYVNRKIAALADNVCEVCCGIASYYKGREPR